MKKLLLSLLLIAGVGYIAQAQAVFEFQVEIKVKTKDSETFGDVSVTLTKGETSVNYQILPLGDIFATPLYESGLTSKSNYKFKKIPAGKYLLKVVDEAGRFAFELIEIKED